MKSILGLLSAVPMMLFPISAWSGERGTAEEAVAMFDKAASHYEAVGKDKALADFTTDKANFNDRDLYLFCFAQSDGLWTAHGANKALIGRDIMKIKDADGKEIGKEFKAVAANGTGWVDYKWPNPTTKKVEPKSSYVGQIGDQICGVGIYK